MLPTKTRRSRDREAIRTNSDRPRGVGGVAVPAMSAGPLAESRIDSLVRASIKSASPVERRRAFDRLLQEMQAPTFTAEQAITMRKAMAEHGASGEQWRLFDYTWGASQPDAAIAHLDEIPEQYHDAFLTNMIPGLASENPQMAIDLFQSLEPELQAKVRPRFLEGLVDNEVTVATGYIYDSTDLENYNWRPMDELARELVQDRGLDATLAWAEELPEGALRGSAWSAAYAVWASKDAESAVQSITDMPPSTDRNLAINGFISSLAHRDGEQAVQWAGEITEPVLREAAQIRAGRQFYVQDGQAATAWFNSSGLPPSAWQQVTSGSRNKPRQPDAVPKGNPSPSS